MPVDLPVVGLPAFWARLREMPPPSTWTWRDYTTFFRDADETGVLMHTRRDEGPNFEFTLAGSLLRLRRRAGEAFRAGKTPAEFYAVESERLERLRKTAHGRRHGAI